MNVAPWFLFVFIMHGYGDRFVAVPFDSLAACEVGRKAVHALNPMTTRITTTCVSGYTVPPR